MNILTSISNAMGRKTPNLAQVSITDKTTSQPPPPAPASAWRSAEPVVATEDQARALGERLTVAPTPAVRGLPQMMMIPPRIVHRLASIITGAIDGDLKVRRTSILQAAGVDKLVLPEEEAAILELVTPYQNVYDFMITVATSKPGEEWSKQQAKIVAEVRAGRGHNLGDSWTIEDYAQDRTARLSALKAEVRKFTAQIIPIAEAVAERIGKVAGVVAGLMEQEEAARCADWGTEYYPTRLIVSLHYIAAHPHEMIGARDTHPLKALAFAGVTLTPKS
jgi:hypothetical protein